MLGRIKVKAGRSKNHFATCHHFTPLSPTYNSIIFFCMEVIQRRDVCAYLKSFNLVKFKIKNDRTENVANKILEYNRVIMR